MTQANETVAELRAKLAEAEAIEKAERAAKRQEENARRREENVAKALAFQDETYTATAGYYDSYVGVISNYNGGVQIDIAEWSKVRSSAELHREQAEELRDALIRILG